MNEPTTDHTVRAFDRELELLGRKIAEMGGIGEKMLADAIDALIRKYGYHGTPATLRMVEENEDLAASLGAAAHLIHGSSEGRFTITYCPGHLTRQEVEGAGFQYAPFEQTAARYNPAKLYDGINELDGEKVFFVSNPALGLWAHRDRFETQG